MIRRNKKPPILFKRPSTKQLRLSADPLEPTVLFVDDEVGIHNLMDHIFEKVGVRGLHAYNGREALAIVSSEPPAMIISDIMMPVMDGWELCRRLKSDPDTMHLPVLILTSCCTPSDRMHGTEIGADEYMSKPFPPKVMMERIRAILHLDPVQG